MSCKSSVHWGEYIPYTGWYALCRVSHPELDWMPAPLTKDWKKVTCPDCKKDKGLYQMLICTCTHKEHGHEHNTGACSRCECKKFIEREVRQ
jgi:hypothetical protein